MTYLINIADLVEENGKTIRENNLARRHGIPTGSLVELEDGVRLYIAWQGRDCDGTPLYWLTPEAEMVRHDNTHAPQAEYWRGRYMGGYSEASLAVVRAASGEPGEPE